MRVVEEEVHTKHTSMVTVKLQTITGGVHSLTLEAKSQVCVSRCTRQHAARAWSCFSRQTRAACVVDRLAARRLTLSRARTPPQQKQGDALYTAAGEALRKAPGSLQASTDASRGSA